jgi:dUTP pyrophosphatase
MQEAKLYIFVDSSEPELLQMYKMKIQDHNSQIDTNEFPNSGFDLLLPNETTFEHNNFKSQLIDFKIKTEMTFSPDPNSPEHNPTAFSIYLRSSICNTPLILANHVGVIDAGYRGNIKGAFRCLEGSFVAEKYTRLIQICHPSYCKIRVVLVDKESDLSTTVRGSGGFGSTGI